MVIRIPSLIPSSTSSGPSSAIPHSPVLLSRRQPLMRHSKYLQKGVLPPPPTSPVCSASGSSTRPAPPCVPSAPDYQKFCDFLRVGRSCSVLPRPRSCGTERMVLLYFTFGHLFLLTLFMYAVSEINYLIILTFAADFDPSGIKTCSVLSANPFKRISWILLSISFFTPCTVAPPYMWWAKMMIQSREADASPWL